MGILILGLILFFVIHSVSIVSEPWRNQMVEKFGENGWKGLYAVISLIGFVLIIWGYGLARQTPIPIYTPPVWLRHLSLTLLIPVFPLFVAAYFPGRIKSVVKHPMLVGTMLWAVSHLMSNGMLADLLLFGTFLVWVLADFLSMSHRQQRAIPGAPPAKRNDLIAILAGLLLYCAFLFYLHGWLIGVSPVTV